MIQKRDKGLAVVWILFFLIQPIAVSYAMGVVSDWTTSTAIDYNITEQYVSSTYVRISNATVNGDETQTVVFNNATKSMIVASIVISTDANNPTSGYIWSAINTTFLADMLITKVVITYNYIGTGNITSIEMTRGLPAPLKAFYATPALTGVNDNGTVTWVPETFEQSQLKVVTRMDFKVSFADSTDLPSVGDYFEISAEFYTSTLLVSGDMILQYIAGALILLDFIAILAITNVWNPRKNN